MHRSLKKCLLSCGLATVFGFLRPVSAIVVKKGPQYLIVKKPRKYNAWQFPQGGRDAGETKMQAAKRELEEECGTKMSVTITPKSTGTYSYLFPENFKRHLESKGIKPQKWIGARVTFFEAQHVSGDPVLDPTELEAYKWVSESELVTYFSPEYFKSLKKFAF